MASDREDKIRARAYQLWEDAGWPEGQDAEHWHQAASEIDQAGPETSDDTELLGTESGDPLERGENGDTENEIVPGTLSTVPDVSGQPSPAEGDEFTKIDKEKSRPNIEIASLSSL